MAHLQNFQESKKFKDWVSSLKKAGISMGEIVPLKIVWKKNGKILFSMFQVEAKDSDNNPLLPIVFLRGDFVSVVTEIVEEESGESFILLVKQRRIGSGEYFYEHPAGMMDDENDPREVAKKELHEETGVRIDTAILQPLFDSRIYSAPGLMDESGYHFWIRQTLKKEEILQLHGKMNGEQSEGEFITTEIVRPSEAFNLIKNAQGLLALYRWREIQGLP